MTLFTWKTLDGRETMGKPSHQKNIQHKKISSDTHFYLFNGECHEAKGKQTCSCFYTELKFVNFFIRQQKNVSKTVFNLTFNEDSKMGVCHFCYCEKLKNTTFVRFDDGYLNIPLWGHSLLISLHCHSYASICLPLAYPNNI